MADPGFLPPWLNSAVEAGVGVLTGAPQPAHHMDLKKLVLSACLPVLKVLIIAGTGLFLATPYMGVLNVDARKHISKVSISWEGDFKAYISGWFRTWGSIGDASECVTYMSKSSLMLLIVIVKQIVSPRHT